MASSSSSVSQELKVNGLILRETPTGDYDKILNMLTAEHGRISVSGKGIKSLKNKNMPATQLFCYSSFLLKRKGNFYYVSESELIENFYGLRGDIEHLSLAAYICDVVYNVTMEDSGESEMLRLALNTLYAIAKKKRSLALIKAAFELKTAEISGFMPDLSLCGECGDNGKDSGERGKETGKSMYIDVMNGRLLCGKCADRIREDYFNAAEKNRPDNFVSSASYKKFGSFDFADVDETGTRMIFIPLSPSVADAMRYILDSKLEKFLSFSIDESEVENFSAVCERYLLNHLEHGFTTLDFYKSIIFK